MAATHGRLFAAIVLGGTALGTNACYLSHTRDEDARVSFDASVSTDARVARDAGHDAAIPIDAACPAVDD